MLVGVFYLIVSKKPDTIPEKLFIIDSNTTTAQATKTIAIILFFSFKKVIG